MWTKLRGDVTWIRIVGSAIALLVLTCVTSGQLPRKTAPKPTIKPAVKPAVTSRTPIDRWIDDVIQQTKFQRDASIAVDMLSEVLEAQNLNAIQRSRVEKELEVYKEYVKQGKVKLGSNWVPIDNAAEATAKADQLIEEGIALLKAGNTLDAKLRLGEASKRDQNGLRADFILAMLNSPLGDYEAIESGRHFKEMQSRSQKLSCAMNNYALIQVRLGEGHYRDALEIWRELDELEPGSPIVLNNVRKLVQDMHSGRLIPTNAEKKAIDNFYQALVKASPAQENEEPEGWQYANLPLSKSEEERTHFDETAVPTLADTGTAFVIHPGYAVTVLHLVQDANRITVTFPGNPPVEAEVEKFSKVYDLALLKLPVMDSPALPLGPESIRPGVMGTQFGYSTKGSPITSRQIKYGAAREDSDFMVFQAPPVRGLRGGPVCDTEGKIVGITTSIGALDAGQTTVIPISHLISLAKKRIQGYAPSLTTEEPPLEPAAIELHHAPSIGLIEVYRKYHNFGIGKSRVPTYALDTKSSCCMDTGKVRCPKKGCNKGIVVVKKDTVVAQDPIAGKIIGKKAFKVKCDTCNGTGFVDCHFPD